MNPSPSSEEILFAHAVALPAAERASYLESACAGDAALRRAVEDLLRVHDGGSAFMAEPAVSGVPNLRSLLPAKPAPDENRTQRLGRYKLLQKIGEGGCGVVYMAEQEEPVRRRVAVKVIKLGMDTREVIARFEAERQALAMMDHPNIARVLDAGETEAGRPYFVMELVRGVKITDYCDQHQLPTAERLKLFAQVCHAVQHAHQKGIIHRDIKPSNILVTLHDGTALPKVIDFGIAKATQGRLTDRTLFTAFEQFIGTPAYMSPEQAEMSSLDVDTRSDVYSLGVLLYELLTGRTPFEAKALMRAGLDEMRRQIREVEPPRPSTRLRTLDKETLSATAQHRHIDSPKLINLISGDLDWIVMRCLEKDRTRRYESAASLAQDLQRHLDNEPVVARPASGAYRFRKMVRRNRTLFAAAAAVLLTLVVGIVGTTLALIRAEKSRRIAEGSRQAEAEQRKLAEAAEAKAQTNERQAASERDRAEQEKRVALAVKDFLQNRLLSQANPFSQADALLKAEDTTGEIKRDPTIRDLLDRAAAELTPEKIESQFANLPLVQAELLRTIGDTYMKLHEGAWETGIAHLERSRDLFMRHLGVDHVETFATLNKLGLAYMRGRKLRQAIQTLEQVRDRQIATLGPDHPDTLETLDNLAHTYRDADQFQDAIQLSGQVYEKRRALLGPNHRATIKSLNELAAAYWRGGDPQKSILLFEQTRDWRIANLGPDHPDLLWTLWGLGGAYRDAQKLTQAIELFEQLHGKVEAKLGPESLLSRFVANNLASAYRAAGQLPKAILFLEKVQASNSAALGSDHAATLYVAMKLGEFYRQAGRLPEAVSILEATLERRKATTGPEHDATARVMHQLAHAYGQTAARKNEELPLYESALRISRAQLGMGHPDTREDLQCLAVAYRNAKRHADAVPLLEELVQEAQKPGGRSQARLSSHLLGLASAYQGMGRTADALRALEEFEQVRKAAPDAAVLEVLYQLSSAIELYRSLGRIAEGIKLGEEALRRRKELSGIDAEATLTAMNNLAMAYRRAGRQEDEVALLEESVRRIRALRGVEHANTLIQMTNLVTTYRLLKRPADALPLARDVVQARKAMLGPENATTLTSMSTLALIHIDLEEWSDAASLFREILEITQRNNPADGLVVAQAKANLAGCLLGQRKFGEAEELGRAALITRESKIPDDWLTFNARSTLGAALAGQRKLEEAEPLLVSGYEGLKAREEKIPVISKFRVGEALERLVQFYEETKKPEKAAQWQRKLDEFSTTVKSAAVPVPSAP